LKLSRLAVRRKQPMSNEDKPEKLGEEKSAKWHRARAKRLREHGFTKMAEEHEQYMCARLRRGAEKERTSEINPVAHTP
jgi:hypothetical protein